jgi:Flp pilus assembly protein TadD/O-antigen ligase
MEKASRVLYLFALVFAPLAFGTVESWSYAVMETAVFAALLCYLWPAVRAGRPLYAVPGLLPLALLTLFVLMQALPLPAGLVRFFSPAAIDLAQQTRGLLEPVGWLPLSLHPKATVAQFFRLGAYLGLYFLTVQMLSHRDRLRATVKRVILFGALLAFLAVVQHLFSNGRLLWMRPLSHGGTLFGPYVNRNHWAGLMEMLFPLCLSLFLFYKPGVSYSSLREKLAELFAQRRTSTHILLGLAAVVMAASVFMSMSRGGIVSLCAAMGLFGLALMLRTPGVSRGLSVSILFVLVLVSVGWYGWEPIFERFGQVRDAAGELRVARLQFWQDSRQIIDDFGLVGTGAGTYADIYPRYRSIGGTALLEHAHNDYLELLCDGGLVAAILAAGFLAAVFGRSLPAFRRRREPYAVYLFLGASAGIASVLIHSVVDFNLQIGANGLYFFLLCGLAVAAAHTRMHEGLGRTYLKHGRPGPRVAASFAAALLLAGSAFHCGVLAGNYHYADVGGIALNDRTPVETMSEAFEGARRAAACDPLESRYRLAEADAAAFIDRPQQAERAYLRALRLQPTAPDSLQALAFFLTGQGRLDTAGRLLQAAEACHITDPELPKDHALWLFTVGRTSEGLAAMRRALQRDPGRVDDYLALMVLYGLDRDQLTQAMPCRVAPRLHFARYLEAVGDAAGAETAHRRALECLAEEENLSASFFTRPAAFYTRNGHPGEALQVLQQGVEHLPQNTSLRLRLAAAYERSGITYRAREEYRQALMLDPGNAPASAALERLGD